MFAVIDNINLLRNRLRYLYEKLHAVFGLLLFMNDFLLACFDGKCEKLITINLWNFEYVDQIP